MLEGFREVRMKCAPRLTVRNVRRAARVGEVSPASSSTPPTSCRTDESGGASNGSAAPFAVGGPEGAQPPASLRRGRTDCGPKEYAAFPH